jgi:Calcium-dependent channel, 7TM region, putative phosphate
MFLVVTIYIFYTIPLQAATSLLEPKSLDNIFPGYMASLENSWFKGIYSGLASGLIFSIFFSLCPVIFKFVANFGSNATSQFHAEYTAMKVSPAIFYV